MQAAHRPQVEEHGENEAARVELGKPPRRKTTVTVFFFTTASGFQSDTGGSGSMGAPSLSRSVLTLQTPGEQQVTQCAPSEAALGPGLSPAPSLPTCGQGT